MDYPPCIGCAQCVDVCPVNCLHMEDVAIDDAFFYLVNLQETTSIVSTLIQDE